jgi:hypothetical protein
VSYSTGDRYQHTLDYLQGLELRPGDLIQVDFGFQGHSFCQLIFGSLESRVRGVNIHSGMPHSIDLDQISSGRVVVVQRGFSSPEEMLGYGFPSP